jgi:NAD(P)-dependent dehydrogenase (short-subunit alcohol dehydrogenase family)
MKLSPFDPLNATFPAMGAIKRTILITGVSRGLGRAMTVIGCGRSGRAIADLKKQFPPPHDFAAVDISFDDQVAAWAGRVLKSHGPPDLLLNNAALIAQNAPLWKVTAKEFSDVLDVNIKGVVNVIRHFVPAMVERCAGVIVNFSSGWGRSADAGVAPYCATKWAIEGLTNSLSQELPAGMAAVPLNPGIIDTDMLRSTFGDSANSYPAPEGWAKTAVPFLLKISAKDNGRQMSVTG